MKPRFRRIIWLAVIVTIAFVAFEWFMCPTDAKLLAKFAHKRAELTELVSLLSEDGDQMSSLGATTVKSSSGEIAPARAAAYHRLLSAIGGASFAPGKDEMCVWCWVHSEGITVTAPSEAKGIMYLKSPAKRFYTVCESLDGLNKRSPDGIYIRLICPSWYLVYMKTS